jgi:hypothetical protein
MKTKAVSLLLFILYASSFAQPDIELIRYYGEIGRDQFFDIYETVSGDFYVCGSLANNAWLLKINDRGVIQWEIRLNGGGLYSVIEADNGDAIATGCINRLATFCIIRVQPDGDVVWTTTYGNGAGRAIIELKAGDFIAAGVGSGDNDNGRMIRVNGGGETTWDRSYETQAERSTINAIRETERGIVGVGSTRGGGWILKVDFDGDTLWSRIYPNGMGNSFTTLISSPRGGFETGASSNGFTLHHFNENGEISATHNYNFGTLLYSINKLSDGGLILVGQTRENQDYPAALRTDSDYNLVWSSEFEDLVDRDGPNGINWLQSVIVTDNDKIMAVGSLYNPDEVLRDDAVLIRFEPDGMSPFIFYRTPEDSLLETLIGDSIQFIVRARDRHGRELSYSWFRENVDLGISDTTITAHFDQFGIDTISCHVSNGEWTSATGWIVTVSDLFIARHTPDTLDLTLRRGVSQTFTLDSVAAIQDNDPIQYLWTLTDLTNQQSNEIGEDSSVTVDFFRSGNYAVTGEAYRGDASDAVTWRVAVRGAVLDFVPPALELTVRTDTTLHFEVFAFNPGSDSLSYAWYFGEDLIGLDSAAEVIFGPEEGIYTISAVVMDGMEGDTVIWSVRTVAPARIEDCRLKIADWGIKEVWPNPFNSQLTISIKLPSTSASASITIHDINGREVASLTGDPPFNSPPASKGGKESGSKQGGNSVTQSLSHSVTSTWDASDMPAGVYFVRLQAGNQIAVKKVVLMR